MLSIVINILNTSIAIAVANWRGHGRIAKGSLGIFDSRKYGLPSSFIPVKSLEYKTGFGGTFGKYLLGFCWRSLSRMFSIL